MGQEYKANLLGGAFASLLLVLREMTGLHGKGVERSVQELHHNYPSRSKYITVCSYDTGFILTMRLRLQVQVEKGIRHRGSSSRAKHLEDRPSGLLRQHLFQASHLLFICHDFLLASLQLRQEVVNPLGSLVRLRR